MTPMLSLDWPARVQTGCRALEEPHVYFVIAYSVSVQGTQSSALGLVCTSHVSIHVRICIAGLSHFRVVQNAHYLHVSTQSIVRYLAEKDIFLGVPDWPALVSSAARSDHRRVSSRLPSPLSTSGTRAEEGAVAIYTRHLETGFSPVPVSETQKTPKHWTTSVGVLCLPTPIPPSK